MFTYQRWITSRVTGSKQVPVAFVLGAHVTKSSKVDDVDLAIIRKLQVDGRRPYADIAAELRLAPSTVQQRANRLIDAGLLKITAAADPLTLGISVSAMVAIKAEGTMLREAAVEIAKFPEVAYVAICTGPYDILVEVACRDNDHLLDFISDKLAEVEGVREIETFLYLRIVKNTDLW